MTEQTYTARLEDWYYTHGNQTISGLVYDDSKSRFVNGSFIHTSRLKNPGAEYVEGDIAETTYSSYLLGKKYIPQEDTSAFAKAFDTKPIFLTTFPMSQAEKIPQPKQVPKKQNYRGNSYSPEEIQNQIFVGYLATLIDDVINTDFVSMTHEQYLDWIEIWKQTYSDISNESTANKQDVIVVSEYEGEVTEFSPISDEQSVRMSYVASLRKYANTLLNARQYAKSVRSQLQNELHEGSFVA
jgi:hypothetical protein